MKTETGTYTMCNGTIAINGYCNQCGQVSQHSGFTCGRLIPVVPTDSSFKTAEQIFNTIPFLSIDSEGKWYSLPKEKVIEAMRAYAEQAIDRCAALSWSKTEQQLILEVKNELK